MRAARVHRFGTPPRIDEIPEPVAGEDEALLQVRFIGVNPVDVWLTHGDVAGGRQPLPFVPGTEAVGLIEGAPAIVHGAGLGLMRDGLYAERAAVPRTAIAMLPPSVDLAEAAAVGVPGSTAWLLVHEVARLTASDRVLVLGATGGVGSLVVQLARHTGAVVWAQTSNADKLPFLRSLSPEGAVVASPRALTAVASPLSPTVVFDALGDGYTDAALSVVERNGRVVLYGTSAGPRGEIDLRRMYKMGAELRAYSATGTPEASIRRAVTSVLAELEAHRIRPFVDAVLPLEEVAEAHRRLRGREVRGKLLLAP